MDQKKGSGFAEQSVIALVIVIPLSALIIYALNQNGFFNAPANASAPITTQVSQQTQQARSSATISLDNPSALPQAVTLGEIVPFSFRLQNLGTIDSTYQYKVYVKWNSGEQDVIDVNSIPVAGGASTDIPESLKFETASSTAQIFIELEPGQSIHFALPR
jgi:hypothetical protein